MHNMKEFFVAVLEDIFCFKPKKKALRAIAWQKKRVTRSIFH